MLKEYACFLGVDYLRVSSAGLTLTVSTALLNVESPILIKCPTDLTVYCSFTVGITGDLTIAGVGATPKLQFGNGTHLEILNTTESTTPSTGALIIRGGLGAGNAYTTSVLLTNPAVTQSLITGYEYYTSAAFSWTGPWTNPYVTSIFLSRFGKRVSIYVPLSAPMATSHAGMIATSVVAIPIEFRPTNEGDAQGQSQCSHNGATSIFATWYVRADGFVEVWAGPTNTSAWGIAGTAGIRFEGYYYKY
jgi:hypothetical protein